jgi:hypothetical protein
MPEFGGGWGGDLPHIPQEAPPVPRVIRPSVEPRPEWTELLKAERAKQAAAERAKQEAADRAKEAAAERGEKHPESDVSAATDKSTGLAPKEGAAFVKDSVVAFGQSLAQIFADAHGFGLVFRVVKLAYGVSKWVRVGEGDGGVALQAPLPVGPDVVLGVSVHLGGDADTPPLTFCIAPGGQSGVGAVSLGELELDPEISHATAGKRRLEVSHEDPDAVELVPVRLAEGLPKDVEAAQAVGAARRLAEEKVLPGLLKRRQRLRDAGVDLIVGYDSAMGLAVWVDLSETARPSEPVVTPDGDQLRVGLGSGVADLVISYDPAVGLTMSLQSRDAEEGSSPVLIRGEPAVQLEARITPEAQTGSPESIVPTEHPRLAAFEGLSGIAVANLIVNTSATQSTSQAARMPGESTEGSTAEVSGVTLTRFVAVPLPPMSSDVTSWLLRSGPLLSKLLGIDIELDPGEDTAGKPATGIVGREVVTGLPVVIDNQHGPADHEHLGQLLTYAAAIKATAVVWVAEEFSDEHQAALDWLNAHTDQTISFFGVRLAAVTLDGARPGLIAPYLELVVQPGTG